MERSDRRTQEPLRSHCAQPVFGLWRAPVFPPAASEDGAKVVQGRDKGEHLTKSPKSLVHPLHQALLSARDMIEKLTRENVTLRQENARLTLKELGTPEALEELMHLYIQAEEEKVEVERAPDSHQMEEEVRESARELCEGRRQVEREITSLEESLRAQREEITAGLSATEDHWRDQGVREVNTAAEVRDSEEKWHRRVSQLEEEMREKRSLVSSLIDGVMAVTEDHRNTVMLLSRAQSELWQSEKTWESKWRAVEESHRKELTEKEESHRKELTEKEESWQRRVQEMERKSELEKMWLQKEKEWRRRVSALEEDIKCLTKEDTRLQGLTGKRKKRKPWWKRRFRLRRRIQGVTGGSSGGESVPLLAQSKEK